MKTSPRTQTLEWIASCDPGWSGGFAWYEEGTLYTLSMPQHPEEIAELFSKGPLCSKSTLIIEAVQGYIGSAHPGSAMFKFGYNYGLVIGSALNAGLNVLTASPQKWQRALGLPKRQEFTTEAKRKAALKRKVQALYPFARITLQTSDAALMLHSFNIQPELWTPLH
ncbi:MAG: hypothetical protein QXI19_07720 [Candidatus Caldarchaeum sp.]